MAYPKSINKQGAGLLVEEPKEELNETLITLLRRGFKFTGNQENVMKTQIQGYLVINFQKETEEVTFEPA